MRPADHVVTYDRDGYVRCRVCGCTERAACEPPCSWVRGQDLCSLCHATARAIYAWQTGARRANWAALLREVARWALNAIAGVFKPAPRSMKPRDRSKGAR